MILQYFVCSMGHLFFAKSTKQNSRVSSLVFLTGTCCREVSWIACKMPSTLKGTSVVLSALGVHCTAPRTCQNGMFLFTPISSPAPSWLILLLTFSKFWTPTRLFGNLFNTRMDKCPFMISKGLKLSLSRELPLDKLPVMRPLQLSSYLSFQFSRILQPIGCLKLQELAVFPSNSCFVVWNRGNHVCEITQSKHYL